jgi:hypothetical protein
MPRVIKLSAIVALLLAGCGEGASGDGPKVGSACRISFRRDALGDAANLPVPVETDTINGVPVTMRGKLLRADRDWIVLEVGSELRWIPRDVVLFIDVPKKP